MIIIPRIQGTSVADRLPLGRGLRETRSSGLTAILGGSDFAKPSPLPPLILPSTCRGCYRQGKAPVVAAGAVCGNSHEALTKEGPQYNLLRRWVQDHGGFVHDSISVTTITQCGARGLVANAAVSLDELHASSLVVVPRALYMDNGAAVAMICPRLGSGARQEAFRERLGQLQQVACCLTAERAKGSESFWLPYINSLPDSPPNPWLLTDRCLMEVLEELVEVQAEAEATTAAAAAAAAHDMATEHAAWEREDDVTLAVAAAAAAVAKSSLGWSAGLSGCRAGWAAAVAAARQRYTCLAAEVLEVVAADRAQLGLDHEGLMWALGQVVSRSLGSGRCSGLLPLIDMANHNSAARPPLMMLDDDDRLVFAVTSILEGELAPLKQGQELFISYQAEGMSPLQAWLKWGFVPHMLPSRKV